MIAKRYVAEAVGTFGIVFAPVALSATSQFLGGASGLPSAALVSGLSVLAMIYALGPVSAAHFNPAVTLGFASVGRFPWRFVPGYIAAQFGGALLATLLCAMMFGPGHGVHVPIGSVLQNIGIEFVLSFFLMFVIIAVATDRRVSSTAPAIAIGFTVVFCVLIGGPITGGSMNPVRSLAPALVSTGLALHDVWLYLLVPPLGAICAAWLYEYLRISPADSVGAPEGILQDLERSDGASPLAALSKWIRAPFRRHF